MIAKSQRDLDIQSLISNYEFHSVNSVIMKPDRALLPCSAKSDLQHALEKLPCDQENHPASRLMARDFLLSMGCLLYKH